MIRTYRRHVPRVHPEAFVHDSAEVIGQVAVGKAASIWPLCSIRGDVDRIVIGERSNIQDLTVIHTRERRPTIVGREVTVGHNVILHGARIGDGALIGMGAIVMEAEVGRGALVGAGALVPAGMRIPPGVLVLGAPAKVVRPLTAAERRHIAAGMRSYLRKAEHHRRDSRSVFS